MVNLRIGQIVRTRLTKESSCGYYKKYHNRIGRIIGYIEKHELYWISILNPYDEYSTLNHFYVDELFPVDEDEAMAWLI